MKKLFLFLGIITLVGFNAYISRKSDSSLKISFELQNVALADGEGSGNNYCYSSFNVGPSGSSYLKCNTPCCWYKDHVPTHEWAGTCSGSSFPDC